MVYISHLASQDFIIQSLLIDNQETVSHGLEMVVMISHHDGWNQH